MLQNMTCTCRHNLNHHTFVYSYQISKDSTVASNNITSYVVELFLFLYISQTELYDLYLDKSCRKMFFGTFDNNTRDSQLCHSTVQDKLKMQKGVKERPTNNNREWN